MDGLAIDYGTKRFDYFFNSVIDCFEPRAELFGRNALAT